MSEFILDPKIKIGGLYKIDSDWYCIINDIMQSIPRGEIILILSLVEKSVKGFFEFKILHLDRVFFWPDVNVQSLNKMIAEEDWKNQ